MAIYGQYFTYDGRTLDTSYILVSLEPKNTTAATGLGRTIRKGEISPFRPVPNFYGTQYSDVLIFDFSIIRTDGNPFTQAETRDLNAWLTSPNSPRKFILKDYGGCDVHENLEYFGLISDHSAFVPDMAPCALNFTFTCSSPYPHAAEEIVTADVTGTQTIELNNTSDEYEWDYYPFVELTAHESGFVTIDNETLDLGCEYKVYAGQRLMIDNARCTITDSFTAPDLHLFRFEDDFNLCWLRLAHGLNRVTVHGNCTCVFKCRYPRKAGI